MDMEYSNLMSDSSNSKFSEYCYDFVHRDNVEIDPRSKENVDKQTLELLKRYCFLYENAKIIIFSYMLSCDCRGDIFKNDAKKIKDAILEYILLTMCKSIDTRNFQDFLEIFEEGMLGYETLEDTTFYKEIDGLKSTLLFKSLIEREKDLIIESRAFDNDFYFELVLRMLSAFIDVQSNSTLINNKYLENISSNMMLPKLKREVLSRYYDIFSFINDPDKQRQYGNCFIYFKPARCTLVSYNEFIGAFSGGYKCRSFVSKNDNGPSFSQIKEVYFKYHDELPYDLEIECVSDSDISKPEGISSCGSKFNINEKEIFCVDGSFYHLCSNCGYIVKVPSSLLKPIIQERIIKRSREDSLLFRKKELLSELTSLDKDYKVLIKSRGE